MMRFLIEGYRRIRIDNFMENSKAAEQDEKKKTSKNIHGCSDQGHGDAGTSVDSTSLDFTA